MKKVITILLIIFYCFNTYAQNVGIGTSSPLARLHVTDSGVLFSATGYIPGIQGLPSLQGQGRRLMWYPDKAAFRVGYVNDANWNKDSIGDFSFASGFDAMAKGISSIAMGNFPTASGDNSTAIGYYSLASGNLSTALGVQTKASGNQSTALGSQTTASGINSTALGYATTASGNYSYATGYGSTALGEFSTVLGVFTKAGGSGSTAMGGSTIAKGYRSTVLGMFNDSILTTDETGISPTTPLFIVGNGNGNTTRRNAMTVLKNGNTGIGTSAPLSRLHVTDSAVLFSAAGNIPVTPGLPPLQGPGRRMMWYPDKAAFRAGYVSATNWDNVSIGNYSIALGNDNVAYGSASIAMGANTGAIGNFSIAMGSSTVASGTSSIAMGHSTQASANYATAMGYNSIASGWYSTAMGENTIAKSGFETVLGRWNSDYTPSSTSGWIGSDRLFTIGNGTSTSTRSDAIVILKNGNTGIGNASPRFPLSFNTANGDKISLYDDGNPSQLNFGIGIFSSQLLQIHSATSGDDIAFGTGNSSNFIEHMRIKGGGRVGIGTTTPATQLEVIGPASATPVTLVIGNRNAFGPAALEFVSDYGLVNQWRPGYIRSNDMGGFTGSLEFHTNIAGNLLASIKGFEIKNGSAYTSTGTLLSWSDARLKNNITAFTDGLNVINKINPVQFYYNADAPFVTDHQQVGVIAQDLEKIAPYMIEKSKQDGYDDLRSVNNQAYTFILINAVKEQQQEIGKQQQQIENQQKQIDDLKKLVEQLLKK